MYLNKHRAQIFSLLIITLLTFGQMVQAKPLVHIDPLEIFKTDDKKPLPPINYVRSRDYDQKHIALDLRFDWDKEITFGIEEFTFSPLKPNFKQLVLDAGLMTFKSVKLKGGDDLEFSYDEKKEKLYINFETAYKVGDEITVIIDYQTKGETVENTLGFGGGGGLKFIKPKKPSKTNPKQIWTQGESEYSKYWFPSFDYPNDFRTSEIKATVKKPMQVISNGKLVETKDNNDGTRTFHWKMETPFTNYLTSIVVGEFVEIRDEYKGIPISTYVYEPWLEEGKVTAKNLPAMVKFFSEKLNLVYPYVKYAQTTGNTFSGGMENITATTQTDNLIIDSRTKLDRNPDGLQAHELAHQWFGNYVTCRDWSEIWLNESFATYLEGLWQLEANGKDYFLYNDLRNNQNAYYNAWNQGNRRPIVTKYYANPDAVFDTYAYPRGGAVLHMLRKQLGDENFFRALNHYLKTNANEPVQTEDFRIAIEESTGQSVDAFFDQWLYRMGHPVFEVTKKYDEQTSELKVEVKQVQKMDLTSSFPQTKYFQMPVDIEIVTAKGAKVETVFIEAKESNSFVFKNVSSNPLLVDFDNEGTLIKEIVFNKPLSELLYQAKNDDDILGRNWAMQELAKMAKDSANKTIKPEIVNFFKNAAISDSTWQLRRAALNKLGELLLTPNPQGNRDSATELDSAVVTMLKRASTDKHSQVRGNAISLLAVTKDVQYASIYKSALTDRSYFVIDQAAQALANTNDKDAFGLLSKLVNTDSWKDNIRISGLNALATLKDKRALNMAFAFAIDEDTPNAVRTAALSVVGSVGKGDKRAYPLIFKSFKTAVENGDVRSFVSGIDSIINLADSRGLEAFELLRNKYKGNAQVQAFIKRKEAEFKAAITNTK